MYVCALSADDSQKEMGEGGKRVLVFLPMIIMMIMAIGTVIFSLFILMLLATMIGQLYDLNLNRKSRRGVLIHDMAAIFRELFKYSQLLSFRDMVRRKGAISTPYVETLLAERISRAFLSEASY